jgi:hypothetical protein
VHTARPGIVVPPGPAAVPSSPDGPASPSGGWAVEYGDAFKLPICTTGASGGNCDNTLYPSTDPSRDCAPQPGFNDDEMEQFSCSQVSVGAGGLTLSCEPADGLVTPPGYDPSGYLCGAVSGTAPQPVGYRFFGWKPGQGQEWAVQIRCKFPPNTGEADPAWWSGDWAWTEEIDFFEGFGGDAGPGGSWTRARPPSNGWIGTTDPTWIYNTKTDAHIGAASFFAKYERFDPSAGFHTYTTVFFPNNTVSEYIDGRIVAWDYVPHGGADYRNGGTVVGPPPSISNAILGLILSYALRDDATGDPDPYFNSGVRKFRIRSIAVYENASADAANAFNAGLAPGTAVSGS